MSESTDGSMGELNVVDDWTKRIQGNGDCNEGWW